MSRVVPTIVIVVLVIGSVGTYAAGAWRRSLTLTPEDVAGIPERLAALPLLTTNPVFRGTRDFLDESIVEKSGADHYVAINYVAEDGGQVRLHVGTSAQTDGWLHEPTVCLPAHGWLESKTTRVPLWKNLPRAPSDNEVWRMMLQKGSNTMVVYYWFQYGDQIVTSRSQRRWHRFNDHLAGRKDRPVQIVILYAPVDAGIERSEKRVEALVRALWPQLSTVLPRSD